jgi:hypothetical protein
VDDHFFYKLLVFLEQVALVAELVVMFEKLVYYPPLLDFDLSRFFREFLLVLLRLAVIIYYHD